MKKLFFFRFRFLSSIFFYISGVSANPALRRALLEKVPTEFSGDLSVAHPLDASAAPSTSAATAAAAANQLVSQPKRAAGHAEKQPVGQENARVGHRRPGLVRVQERIEPHSHAPHRQGPHAEDGAVERQQRAAQVGQEGHAVEEDVPEGEEGVEPVLTVGSEVEKHRLCERGSRLVGRTEEHGHEKKPRKGYDDERRGKRDVQERDGSRVEQGDRRRSRRRRLDDDASVASVAFPPPGAALAVHSPHRGERRDEEERRQKPPGPRSEEHQNSGAAPVDLVCSQGAHEGADEEPIKEEVARVAWGNGGRDFFLFFRRWLMSPPRKRNKPRAFFSFCFPLFSLPKSTHL